MARMPGPCQAQRLSPRQQRHAKGESDLNMAEGSRISCWRTKTVTTVALTGGLLILGQAAFANGEPRLWEIGMQPAASPVRVQIDALYNELLVIIALVALLVMALLIYVIVRYNARRNPIPSTTSHNTLIEIIWTTVPVLILLAIAIPSFKLIYYIGEATAQHPGMTLKITAHQWYWTYKYPDQGDLSFDSNIIPDNELKPGQVRLLDVDNRVVLPVNTTVRLLVTSSDVIHSFFVPSLGVQEYAIPGRINEA